jgi:hypothetical protein
VEVHGQAHLLGLAQQRLPVVVDQAGQADLVVAGREQHTLNFVSVESGFGHIPFLLESLDWQWMGTGAHQRYPEPLMPSDYFRGTEIVGEPVMRKVLHDNASRVYHID